MITSSLESGVPLKRVDNFGYNPDGTMDLTFAK
jgi:hypothetical protein